MKKNIVILILMILFGSIMVFANKKEKLVPILEIKQNPKIIQNKKINGVLCSNGEYYLVNQLSSSFNNNCICGNFYITHWIILEEDTVNNNNIVNNKNILTQ